MNRSQATARPDTRFVRRHPRQYTGTGDSPPRVTPRFGWESMIESSGPRFRRRSRAMGSTARVTRYRENHTAAHCDRSFFRRGGKQGSKNGPAGLTAGPIATLDLIQTGRERLGVVAAGVARNARSPVERASTPRSALTLLAARGHGLRIITAKEGICSHGKSDNQRDCQQLLHHEFHHSLLFLDHPSVRFHAEPNSRLATASATRRIQRTVPRWKFSHDDDQSCNWTV